MTKNQAMKDGEKVFPIFYKKKVLSLVKTKELQRSMKEVMQENDELLENEKLMLNKIRMKHDEFVARLESHLEHFKKANIQKIILEHDMLPVWSQDGETSQSTSDNVKEIDDTTERLAAWYNTMNTYVNLQFEGVKQILSDWFSLMDKISSEGEPDLQITDVNSDLISERLDAASWSENIFWYITILLFCIVNLIIFFFNPEDISKCIDNGFYMCFVNTTKKIGVFLYHHYLKFHNITIDNHMENCSSEGTVQCSLDAEL